MSGKARFVVSSRKLELDAITNFWRSMPKPSELPGTLRRSLTSLRRTAEECLSKSPPDLKGARSATAEALYWMRSDKKG